MILNYNLKSKDKLTTHLRENGITSWNILITYLKQLPYGRNSNRKDLTLVITEAKGTCSSKHALLKKVADLNGIKSVKLILGIYKMNARNTPKIGNIIAQNELDYIPEAHCYLMINSERLDFTITQSNFKTIENDVLIEKEITPSQIETYKIAFHKAYLKQWLKTNNLAYSFETIWNIREQCINKLSKN